MRKYTRRQFLVTAGKTGAVVALAGYGIGRDDGVQRELRACGDLAVASGNDSSAMVAAAVGALGGISAFVRKGSKVVIKPNAAWARRPEEAVTTNPQVVAAVVDLCKKAGASEILVVEHVIDRPADRVFDITGIRAACEAVGARIVSADSRGLYRRLGSSAGHALSEVEVISDVLDADVFINLPIAKCHRESKVSLGLKNLMGVVWNRQEWHSHSSVDGCVAQLAKAVKPHLTILDANRILMSNGPHGPGETKDVGLVVAGVDPVAVDAYGATLFGLRPGDVEHVRLAHEYGVGEIDLDKIKIARVQA